MSLPNDTDGMSSGDNMIIDAMQSENELKVQKLELEDDDDDDDDDENFQDASGNIETSSTTSAAAPLNGKEEIRRRLAFEFVDDDDPIAQYKLNRRKNQKPLSTRLQNLDSLQICFLNENNENFTFDDLNQTTSSTSVCNVTGAETNNNDIVMQNRIYYLFKKLQKVNFDLDQIDLFADIEKPQEKSKFSEYHSKLYTEAKLTLSQIKEICKLRLKIEKENEKETSSIYDLIHNLPPDFQRGVSKFTVPILKRLRISELQLIVNDMFSRIEKLNASLVKLLITRDELYMEQDSLLVDIEDLTKFLLSK